MPIPLEFSFNVCICVLIIIVYKLFVLSYNPINLLKKNDSGVDVNKNFISVS